EMSIVCFPTKGATVTMTNLAPAPVDLGKGWKLKSALDRYFPLLISLSYEANLPWSWGIMLLLFNHGLGTPALRLYRATEGFSNGTAPGSSAQVKMIKGVMLHHFLPEVNGQIVHHIRTPTYGIYHSIHLLSFVCYCG